jgi:hypothetical protein
MRIRKISGSRNARKKMRRRKKSGTRNTKRTNPSVQLAGHDCPPGRKGHDVRSSALKLCLTKILRGPRTALWTATGGRSPG